MDIIDSYCDISFDDQLLNIENINRLPWVGLDYQDRKPKTLILGESVYDWNPNDPKSIDRIYDSYNLRKLHKAHALDFKRNSAFVRNIERAIYSKKRPTNEEKLDFWNSVVFHNLVSRVLKTKKHRPSYDDYYSGWKVFDEIVSVFNVEQVIVYGLENKKIDAFRNYFKHIGVARVEEHNLSKVGLSKPMRFIIEKDGKSIVILFIRHPSAFFSWKKWSTIIHSELTFLLKTA